MLWEMLFFITKSHNSKSIQCIVISAQTISATLWAGTNTGQVLIFLLNIPNTEEKRKNDKVSAMLAKEIQLKHKAPVLCVQVLILLN